MGFSVPHITKLFQVNNKLFADKGKAEEYVARLSQHFMGAPSIQEVMAFVVEETGSAGITKHYFLATRIEISE